MKRVGGVAAIAAGVVALAGCGGQASGDGSSSTTSSASASSTSSSTTTTEASPTPWASVVSEQNFDLTELMAEIEKDCNSPALDMQVLSCTLQFQTAQLKGQILRKRFDELGEPPAEVATLVEETLRAADLLGSIEIDKECENATVDSYFLACAGPRVKSQLYGKDLLAEYAAWGSYGA